MKKFFRNSISFFLIVLLIQSFLVAVSTKTIPEIYKKKYILSKNRYAKKSDIFILGSSTTECGVNEIWGTANYINISKSAEPLFYTVLKAKSLLADLNLDTMIIEFNNNSLNTVRWVLDDDRLVHNYSVYFAKLGLEDHFFLLTHNPTKALKTLFSMSPLQIFHSHKAIDGHYLYLKRDNLRHPQKGLDFVKKIISKNYSFDVENVGLKMLMELVDKNPKTYFIFTRMPMHSSLKPMNELYYKKCISLITKRNNTKYIDFKNTPLNDSLFGDAVHLNHFGADVFSPIFFDSISSRHGF